MEIYKKLAEINKKIGAIGKNQKNAQQGFKFRGIDDVMNELHGLFAEHEVLILPNVIKTETIEKVNNKGTLLFYVKADIEFTFVTTDGSNVKAYITGEAMDSGDKATNKAMSIALKYALLQMFLIPTEEPKDPDGESHEVLPVSPKEKQKEPAKTRAEQKKELPEKNFNYTVQALKEDRVTMDKLKEIYNLTPDMEERLKKATEE